VAVALAQVGVAIPAGRARGCRAADDSIPAMPSSLSLRLPSVWACALLLGLAWLLAAPRANAQGAVVAMGGAVHDESPIWAEVVRLAGGAGARFVLFTMSSSEPEGSAASLARRVQRHGAVAEHIAVGPRYGDVPAATREARWIAAVDGAQGALFSGGDQNLVTQALAPGGIETPLLQAVRRLLARGGVVAGSSAGAAIMSQRMFTGGNPLPVLQGREREPIVAAGLGLIAAPVLVDQHFIARGRIARLLPTLLAEGLPLGLGVEENSAVLVRGSGDAQEAEVLGSRGVLVVDVRQARRLAADGPFHVQGARLSWLEAGDRVNLSSGRITPAPAKAAGRRVAPPPPGFRPYWRGPAFFADLLSPGTLVQALAQLADSPQQELRGLAFDALAEGHDERATLGFEWIFSRGPDTSAWNLGDAYTVADVRLEVRPVRMARPLFTPWR
jgi:cyanophycinase